jgi:hypothetical protein
MKLYAQQQAKDALELVRDGIDPAEEHERCEEAEVVKRIEGFTFGMLAKQFLKEHVEKLTQRVRKNSNVSFRAHDFRQPFTGAGMG